MKRVTILEVSAKSEMVEEFEEALPFYSMDRLGIPELHRNWGARPEIRTMTMTRRFARIQRLRNENGDLLIAIGPKLNDALLGIVKAPYEDELYEIKQEMRWRAAQISGLSDKIKAFNSAPWYARMFMALRGL